MSSRRIDNVKYPGFDLFEKETVENIFNSTVARRDSLNADIEFLAGHMIIRGWVEVEEAYEALDKQKETWVNQELAFPEE